MADQDWFDQNKPKEDWFEKNKPKQAPITPPPRTATMTSGSRLGNALRALNFESQQAESPIPIILRKAGSDLSNIISPRKELSGPQPESAFRKNPVREFAAVGVEGLSNFLANLFTPQNIALTGTGAQAIKTGAAGYKAASIGLATPMTAEGLMTATDSDRTAEERIMGGLQAAGGLGAMYFPKGVRPTVNKQDTRQKLLPSATYRVSPEGEVGVPYFPDQPSMRERAGGTNPRSPIQAAAPDVIDVTPTKVEERIVPTDEQIKPNFVLPRFMSQTEPNEIVLPVFEGTTKAKMETNTKELAPILASGYQKSGPKVVLKELIQNSFDAIRRSDRPGNITVRTSDLAESHKKYNYYESLLKSDVFKDDQWYKDIRDRYKAMAEQEPKGEVWVEVSDDGPGMTQATMLKEFKDLGESGKRLDAEASGGFGVAKAAPLLGGKKVEVKSVAREANGKLYEHSFSGTPEEIIGGYNVMTKKVPEGTPTGVTVRTYFDESKSGIDDLKLFSQDTAKYSKGVQGKITHNAVDYVLGDKMEEEYKADLSSPTADVELIVPKNIEYADRDSVEVAVLNNGLYQDTIKYSGGKTMTNVPKKIIVDVKSKVREGHVDYPFTMTREALKGPVHTDLSKYIQENIISPGLIARSKSIKEAYDKIADVDGVHYYDAGQKFTVGELSEMMNSPILRSIGNVIDGVIREAIEVAQPELMERLDGTGIIFDQDWNSWGSNKLTHGLWIPDPGTNKAKIMLNPLGSMSELNLKGVPPLEAAGMIHHAAMHEINHFNVGPHGDNFTSELSKLYARYQRRGFDVESNAKQRIYRELTGGGEGYLPEVQELLRVYQESRRRQGSTNDPLYRTGIKSADSQRTGEKKVRTNPKRNPEAVTAASTKLLDALKTAIPLRREQDEIYSATRSERFKNMLKVKSTGRAGAVESLNTLKGEMEKVEQAPIQLSVDDETLLFDSIKLSPLITPGEKARGYGALMKLIDGGPVLQPGEIAVLDRVFGGQFGSQIVEMQGGLGAVGIKLAKTFNTMKTMMSSFDVSAPFRQGAGKITRLEFWKAYAEMFKMAGSEQAYRATMDAIESHPNYILAREHGLYIADETMSGREEHFLESYITDLHNKMGAKARFSPFRASERAYTGFLNKLRFDTFNAMVENLVKAGYTADQVAPAVAREINTSTGRGRLKLGLFKLGKGEDTGRNSNLLNNLLFSPRLIASRLTILNPKYYVDTPSYMRMEALRSLFGIAGTVVLANAVGQMLGGDSTVNPTSSDFGKIRFGKVRLDPGTGFLQYIVLAARMLSNQYTDSQPTGEGELYDMSEGRYSKPNRFSLLMSDKNYPGFIESKGSPAATLITSFLRGKNFAGQPINVPAEVRNRFIPIILQDLQDLYKDDPNWIPQLSTLALGGLAASGMGVQTYEDRRKRNPNSPRLGGLGGLRP